MNINYKNKYLEFKTKYFILKKLYGGASYSFKIIEPIKDNVYPFAYYWWKEGYYVWYSDNQKGYYFNNYRCRYMSKAHTHIYDLERVKENGKDVFKYYFTTSGTDGNHIHENEVKTASSFEEVFLWLKILNNTIGARPS